MQTLGEQLLAFCVPGSAPSVPCLLCRQPIAADDSFGLSERVCRRCCSRGAARIRTRRDFRAWLRRAA
jgi:hypothetical protein